jgi:imidazole glycerol-phosphate synthase subunit HisF
MLCSRVIPCLDVRAGRVVKGVRFRSLRDVGDPAELAARYEDQGADEVVILDVSATLEERLAGLEAVGRVRRRLSIPLTVGGGLRTVEDCGRLLSAGADRVSVNSAAIARPELVRELAERFGSQCVVVAIDAAPRQVAAGASKDRPGWTVAARSATVPIALDPAAWAADCARLGAGEVLLTSIDRDGTGDGYDLALLSAVCGAVPIPVIASGGASSPMDLLAALNAGASAVLVASILHDNQWTVSQLKSFLADQGTEVRK